MADLATRFWSKVDIRGPDECWPWQAGRSKRGYGRFREDGKTVEAHRVAFKLHTGKAPDHDVLHSCDNRPCQNPGHLRDGTNAENVADRNAKGRQARGERHGRTKVTDAQVRAIRSDPRALRLIMAEYGISEAQARRIRTGRSRGEQAQTTQDAGQEVQASPAAC